MHPEKKFRGGVTIGLVAEPEPKSEPVQAEPVEEKPVEAEAPKKTAKSKSK